MAKEFKEYDKKYRHLLGRLMPYESVLHDALCGDIMRWKYQDRKKIWSVENIAYAVYTSTTAEAWQQFRVSLKNCSTQWKLKRLELRYERMLTMEAGSEERMLEECRIDNYIGALRRGGQLNTKLEVVR